MRLQLIIVMLLACLALAWAEPAEDDRALGLRTRALLAQLKESPAQEGIFRTMRGGNLLNGISLLTGEKPGSADEIAVERKTIEQFAAQLTAWSTWPAPPKVTVPRTAESPVIDGVLNEPAWQHARVFTHLYPFDKREAADGPAVTWRLLWDDRYLYLGVECADSEIIAPALPRDGAVYNDDCVELFLLPDMATRSYWEIEVGATGSVLDTYNVKNPDRWGGKYDFAANLPGLLTATHIDGTPNHPGDHDTGFTVEMAVPFERIPAKAAPDTTIRFLLTRFERTANGFTPCAAWPLVAWVQNIWNYGTLTLAP